MLVPAHELQAHGLSRELRKNRGGLRHVVVATVAVGARAFVILHAHFLCGQAENSGESVARGVDVLRRADYERGIGVNVRERAIGAKGRVRLIRAVVCARGDVRGCGKCGRNIAALEHHVVRGFFGAHRGIEAVAAGERGGHVPGDFQIARRADRVPFALGDDADEIAFAHDASAGDVRERIVVEGCNFRARAVRALAARPHYASVQHAGQAHVLQIDIRAAHFAGNVVARRARADEFVIRHGLQQRFSGEGQIEVLVADEFAVGDGFRAESCGHDALRDRQAFHRRVEFLRRHREQCLPSLGRRRANRRRAARDRRTRIRSALIGREVSIEAHGADLAHVEVELFGGNLQQRSRRALAELDVADVDRRGVVAVNREPRVDLPRIGAARDGRSLREKRVVDEARAAEADHERAAGLQKFTARKRQARFGD